MCLGQDLELRADTLANPPFIPKGDATCSDGIPPRLTVALAGSFLRQEAFDALNKILTVISVHLAPCNGDDTPSHWPSSSISKTRANRSTETRWHVAVLGLNALWNWTGRLSLWSQVLGIIDAIITPPTRRRRCQRSQTEPCDPSDQAEPGLQQSACSEIR